MSFCVDGLVTAFVKTTTDLETAVENTINYIKIRGTKPFDYTFPLEIINSRTPKTWKDRLI